MKIEQKAVKEADFPCSTLILPVVREATSNLSAYRDIDRMLNGALSDIMKDGVFSADTGQTHLVHSFKKLRASYVLLVGLGEKKDASPERLRQAGGKAASYLASTGLKTAALSVRLIKRLNLNPCDFAEGMLLGLYKFDEYKKNENWRPPERLTVLSEEDIYQELEYIEAVASGVYLARNLVNTPSNEMTPSALVRTAKALAGGKVLVKVLEKKQVERLGMGAFLSVAKGSDEPAKFIVINYRGSSDAPVVLIGKSITFDSGGISLKPAEGMEKMKYDMAGGAAVLGVIKAVSELHLHQNIIGILPATENLPGGHASKPGDVVRTITGKTVEIISTDAEGRLALADAIGYARKLNPYAIIDIATLTGACSVALGNEAIAMMGNSESLMRRLEEAAESTSERLWRMPLYDEYKEYLKSDIADMKNSGGKTGSLVTAGYFLKEFAENTNWVHLDIAGTAWTDKDRPYCPKGATGIGVRLLMKFLASSNPVF